MKEVVQNIRIPLHIAQNYYFPRQSDILRLDLITYSIFCKEFFVHLIIVFLNRLNMLHDDSDG